MLMMDGEEELAAFEKNIFKDYETRPPKLIVLLGTASFILCEDLDRQRSEEHTSELQSQHPSLWTSTCDDGLLY